MAYTGVESQSTVLLRLKGNLGRPNPGVLGGLRDHPEMPLVNPTGIIAGRGIVCTVGEEVSRSGCPRTLHNTRDSQ